jgi:hypothetical protein
MIRSIKNLGERIKSKYKKLKNKSLTQPVQPPMKSSARPVPPPMKPSARPVPPPMKPSAQPVPPPMKPSPQPSAQPVPPPMKPSPQPSARPVPPPMKPSARPVPPPMKPSVQPVPPPMKPSAQPVPPPMKPSAQPVPPPMKPSPQVIQSKLNMTDKIIRRYNGLQDKIKDYKKWKKRIRIAATNKGDNHILSQSDMLDNTIEELSTIFENSYYDNSAKQYKFSDRLEDIDHYKLSDRLDGIVFYYNYILKRLKQNYNIHYSETFEYFFSTAGEKPENVKHIPLNNSDIAYYNELKLKIDDYKKWKKYIKEATRGDYHILLQSDMLDNSIEELSTIFANGYYHNDSIDPDNLKNLLHSIPYHYDNILIALREKYTRPVALNFKDFFTYEEKYPGLKKRGLIPPLPFKIGGKKSKKPPKKEILGKMRIIHKIPGDHKEYVQHKGKLITVKDYKKLMKDKKPKKK